MYSCNLEMGDEWKVFMGSWGWETPGQSRFHISWHKDHSGNLLWLHVPGPTSRDCDSVGVGWGPKSASYTTIPETALWGTLVWGLILYVELG